MKSEGFLRIRRQSSADVLRGREGLGGAIALPTPVQATGTGDDYNQRLIKLIPAEALALFPFGMSLIPDAAFGWELFWLAFCLAFTLVFRWRHTRDAQGRPQVPAMVISGASFLIWVMMSESGFGVWDIPADYAFVPVLIGVAWVALSTQFYRGEEE